MSHCPFHYHEHRSTDLNLINQFIDMFPLALITTYTNGTFHSSHIPLLRSPDGTLFGHVDRRNPQFMGVTSLISNIVFSGPSSYIPPEAYISAQLPTWNYVAVHMHANIIAIDKETKKLDILTQSAIRFSSKDSDYRVNPQDPRVARNLQHILGITVHPLSIEGRFKLSKDKPLPDHTSALDWLLKQQIKDQKKLIELWSSSRSL